MALYFIARPGYNFGASWPGTKVGSNVTGTEEFVAWHASIGSGVLPVPLPFVEAPAALVRGVLDLYVTNTLEGAQTIANGVPGSSIHDFAGNLLGSTPPADTPPADTVSSGFLEGGLNGYILTVYPWELASTSQYVALHTPVNSGAPEVLSLKDKGGLKGVFLLYEARQWTAIREKEAFFAGHLEATVLDWNSTFEGTLGMASFLAVGRVHALWVVDSSGVDTVYNAAIWSHHTTPDGPYAYKITNGELSLYRTPDGTGVVTDPNAGFVEGGSGDDRLDSPDGSNTIDGKEGFDVVVYSGQRAGFEVRLGIDGMVIVTKPNGTDTLVSIERLEFSDGTLAFDFDGNAGQAYRLYQAAFDRLPDTEGLSYWIGRLDSGTTSLNAVADSFLHSPEFVSTYGTEQTVGNARFVELLYLHTLGRDYDQSGFDYWVERLDGGHTNRGDLLAFFSESDENVARVAPAIQEGIWFV